MRIHKPYIILGMLLAFGVFFELAAHADDANEATTITFSAPVQIPGRVLPAGIYLSQQADSNDLNLVQIFNADRSLLYATLETVPADRMNSAAHTAITLAEPAAGTPISREVVLSRRTDWTRVPLPHSAEAGDRSV